MRVSDRKSYSSRHTIKLNWKFNFFLTEKQVINVNERN